MGGYGTWDIVVRQPTLFAGALALCGGGDSSQAAAIRDLPVWAFHGELDTTVAPSFTTVLVEALLKCGGSPKLTLYPNEGHSGAWNQAYSGQELFDWMLTHQN